MIKTYELIVHGIVQGVGFRYTTKQLADELEIYGSVKNLPDGTVHIIAQGDSLVLQKFISTIKVPKSPFAKVTYLDIKEINSKSYSDFHVVY